MGDLLIRNVDDKVIKRLKARAKRNGRSLQGELRTMVESASASEEVSSILDRAAKRRQRMRPMPDDSTDLIREDRER